jgi:hypothetical protein
VGQSVPGGLGSQLPLHAARKVGEVVSLFLVLIFTRGCVDPRAIVGSEGNMSLKNPVTPRELIPRPSD